MLVTLGALITVTIIVIDPFAQQIVKYSSYEQVSTVDRAFIPRTNGFSNVGTHIGAVADSVDLGMQSAVNVGIFAPATVAIPFTCSTGNCAFPEYRSIAYCGSCTDISSEVSMTQLNETTTMYDNSTHVVEGSWNFTLPSGLLDSSSVEQVFRMSAVSGYYEIILGTTVIIVVRSRMGLSKIRRSTVFVRAMYSDLQC
jgi:hypothetical protein